MYVWCPIVSLKEILYTCSYIITKKNNNIIFCIVLLNT